MPPAPAADPPVDAAAARGNGFENQSRPPPGTGVEGVSGSPCTAVAQTATTPNDGSAHITQNAGRVDLASVNEKVDVGQLNAQDSCLEEGGTAGSQRDDWQVVVPKSKQRASGGGGSNSSSCAKGDAALHSAGKGHSRQVAIRHAEHPASEKQQQQVQHSSPVVCKPAAAGTSAVASKGKTIGGTL